MVGTVQQFISTNPVVKDWHSTISRKRTSTADLYAQSLHTYWVSSVKLKGFGNISNWLMEIKSQQQSDDVKERRQWATDLLNWFDTYKSTRTKRPLTTDTRNVFVAVIKGFLVHHLGDIQALAEILSTPPLGLKQVELGKIWLSPGRQIAFRFGYPNEPIKRFEKR